MAPARTLQRCSLLLCITIMIICCMTLTAFATSETTTITPNASIEAMNDKIYRIYRLIRNNIGFPLLSLSFASCGFKILGAGIIGSGMGTDRGIQAAKEQIITSVCALLLLLALPHILTFAIRLFKRNAWTPPGATILPFSLFGGVFL